MVLALSSKQQKWLVGVLIALVIAVWQTWTQASSTVVPALKPITPIVWVQATTTTVITNALVVRAVDGDTIEVRLDGEAGNEKIRFLGINTPESVDPRRPVQCFGKEASHVIKELIEGKRIRLEEDPQSDNRDKYHRLLRNIVLEDGTDVNAMMVRSGYAYAYLSFPLNKFRKKQLSAFQAEAEFNKRGFWADNACGGKTI